MENLDKNNNRICQSCGMPIMDESVFIVAPAGRTGKHPAAGFLRQGGSTGFSGQTGGNLIQYPCMEGVALWRSESRRTCGGWRSPWWGTR